METARELKLFTEGTQSRRQVVEVMMDCVALSCKVCTSWQGISQLVEVPEEVKNLGIVLGFWEVDIDRNRNSATESDTR